MNVVREPEHTRHPDLLDEVDGEFDDDNGAHGGCSVELVVEQHRTERGEGQDHQHEHRAMEGGEGDVRKGQRFLDHLPAQRDRAPCAHERKVALKVLKPELAAVVGAEGLADLLERLTVSTARLARK